jgi:hypothetical protein
MPGPASTGNWRYAVGQKLTNHLDALFAVACSHVRARYPQAGPQFPGASGKAQTRCVQGFASNLEIFLLDPQQPAV